MKEGLKCCSDCSCKKCQNNVSCLYEDEGSQNNVSCLYEDEGNEEESI
jgi:hypothetical protein